jgi:hypothetical protein
MQSNDYFEQEDNYNEHLMMMGYNIAGNLFEQQKED